MTPLPESARRRLFAVFAACAAGGTAALTVPAGSTAAPDPCAASSVAKTVGSVANSTATYLDAHPQTNQALTTISQQQGGPQSLAALKTYFDANPQAAKDMQALQAPLQSLSARCRLPFTLPQVMGLLQGAQAPAGSVPGSLPSALSTVPNGGASGVALPAQAPPATAVAPGTGPLPGPSTVTPR